MDPPKKKALSCEPRHGELREVSAADEDRAEALGAALEEGTQVGLQLSTTEYH